MVAACRVYCRTISSHRPNKVLGFCQYSMASERNGLGHGKQGFFCCCISEVSVNKSNRIVTIVWLLPVQSFFFFCITSKIKIRKYRFSGFQRPPGLSCRGMLRGSAVLNRCVGTIWDIFVPQRRGHGFYQRTGQAARAQGQTRGARKSLRWVKQPRRVQNASASPPQLSLPTVAA